MFRVTPHDRSPLPYPLMRRPITMVGLGNIPKVNRPYRFNQHGQLTAIGGIPVKGAKVEGDSEAFSPDSASQFGYELGALAEADGDTTGIEGWQLHAAQMLGEGNEEAMDCF